MKNYLFLRIKFDAVELLVGLKFSGHEANTVTAEPILKEGLRKASSLKIT